MRPKNDQLRQEILQAATRLAATQGAEAINMRAIAKQCGVSLGSVYNYFEGKDEIIHALAVVYWQEALQALQNMHTSTGFLQNLNSMYTFLLGRVNSFTPGLLAAIRSAGAGDIRKGKQSEQAMLQALHGTLLALLKQDTAISADVWGPGYTMEGCATFVLANLFGALQQRAEHIDFLLETLRRVLYSPPQAAEQETTTGEG